MKRNPRVAHWQYVRGLCIVLVVLIHSRNGILYQNGDYSWNFNYWLLLRSLINFPVAIFIFLSGYFYKYENVEINTKDRILYRIKQLIVPFFTWSIIYTFINNINDENDIHLLKESGKLLLGMSSGQLYFILVLIQLTMISPFLVKIIKQNKYSELLFYITPAYLIVLYIYIFIFGQSFLFYQMFFPAWLIFYYFGLWVKIKGYPRVFLDNIWYSLMFFIIAMLFSILESFTINVLNFPVGFASSQIKISSYIYVFTVINLMFTFKSDRNKESRQLVLLGYLGDHSLGIYYVHMIYISITGYIITAYLPQLNNMLPVFQILQVILTIVFSICTINITKIILGDKISKKFFGF